MSNVGTQRVPGYPLSGLRNRSSPTPHGFLTNRSGGRGARFYARQSPVRPSQQPTLKRHRGHWKVPWRHSIAAAHRGHGSTTGSGVGAAGEGAATPLTVGRAADVGSRGGCPVTPSGHPPARAPALRAARLRGPRPPSQELRNAALVPRVARREPSRGRVSSFPYRSKRRRADSNRCTRLCRPLPNHSATSPGGRIVAPPSRHRFARGVVALATARVHLT